jgi:hypothetical protein
MPILSKIFKKEKELRFLRGDSIKYTSCETGIVYYGFIVRLNIKKFDGDFYSTTFWHDYLNRDTRFCVAFNENELIPTRVLLTEKNIYNHLRNNFKV